jgi:prepilin-type N-terminal cleavage/methylation domain-containing protein
VVRVKESGGSNNGAGFTLLEIMIAIAIIGITLSVILHTVNYHADILYDNTITTQMYQLAKEKMYELEKLPANTKGKLNVNFTFQNTISVSEESNIMELKTVVRGYDRAVTLTELMIKKIQ